jgi:hypothetical protein
MKQRIEPSKVWALKTENANLRAETERLKALLDRVRIAVQSHHEGAVMTYKDAVAKIEDLLS